LTLRWHSLCSRARRHRASASGTHSRECRHQPRRCRTTRCRPTSGSPPSPCSS